jgi:glyoxylate reductase
MSDAAECPPPTLRPPLPRNYPLLAFDNVVITPHLGRATEQTRRRMAELFGANLLAGRHGEPLPCEVRGRGRSPEGG